MDKKCLQNGSQEEKKEEACKRDGKTTEGRQADDVRREGYNQHWMNKGRFGFMPELAAV